MKENIDRTCGSYNCFFCIDKDHKYFESFIFMKLHRLELKPQSSVSLDVTNIDISKYFWVSKNIDFSNFLFLFRFNPCNQTTDISK